MQYKSSTQGAYERLRADLLSCRLKPGQRLPISDLCQALQVSLGAVREALSRLTSEGLVSLEPQCGFRAAPISTAELLDLTRVRIEIEALCIRAAFAAGDIAWEARVLAAYHQLSKTPPRAPDDPQRANDAFRAAHAKFHQELVSPCQSPWLLRLREILYAQSERYLTLSFPLARKERDTNKEHSQLADAVLSGDAEKTVELMTAHLQKTTGILMESIELEEAASDARGAKRERRTPTAVASRQNGRPGIARHEAANLEPGSRPPGDRGPKRRARAHAT